MFHNNALFTYLLLIKTEVNRTVIQLTNLRDGMYISEDILHM